MKSQRGGGLYVQHKLEVAVKSVTTNITFMSYLRFILAATLWWVVRVVLAHKKPHSEEVAQNL